MSVSKATREQLGAELRALRKQAGLTLRQVEASIGVSNAAISYWENGHRLPGSDDLRRLLDALRASDEDRERILGVRRAADDAPGQIAAGTPHADQQTAQLIAYERTATKIFDGAPLLVPGLLQTADYARAIMGNLADAEIRVGLRASRRDILTRRFPVQLTAVIDTEVLVRPIAPQDVMIDQLHHLLEMSHRPNITIRLISSTRPGYTPMLSGAFKIIEFPKADPIVYLEHYRSSMFMWEAKDVRDFAKAAEETEQAAMTPAESAGVIEDIVNGLETRTT